MSSDSASVTSASSSSPPLPPERLSGRVCLSVCPGGCPRGVRRWSHEVRRRCHREEEVVPAPRTEVRAVRAWYYATRVCANGGVVGRSPCVRVSEKSHVRVCGASDAHAGESGGGCVRGRWRPERPRAEHVRRGGLNARGGPAFRPNAALRRILASRRRRPREAPASPAPRARRGRGGRAAPPTAACASVRGRPKAAARWLSADSTNLPKKKREG